MVCKIIQVKPLSFFDLIADKFKKFFKHFMIQSKVQLGCISYENWPSCFKYFTLNKSEIFSAGTFLSEEATKRISGMLVIRSRKRCCGPCRAASQC